MPKSKFEKAYDDLDVRFSAVVLKISRRTFDGGNGNHSVSLPII